MDSRRKQKRGRIPVSYTHLDVYKRQAVRTVSMSSYSMSEWEEAFRYITGVRTEFKSKEELVKNLILRLEENKEL